MTSMWKISSGKHPSTDSAVEDNDTRSAASSPTIFVWRRAVSYTLADRGFITRGGPTMAWHNSGRRVYRRVSSSNCSRAPSQTPPTDTQHRSPLQTSCGKFPHPHVGPRAPLQPSEQGLWHHREQRLTSQRSPPPLSIPSQVPPSMPGRPGLLHP
jgi:hypothetical protein